MVQTRSALDLNHCLAAKTTWYYSREIPREARCAGAVNRATVVTIARRELDHSRNHNTICNRMADQMVVLTKTLTLQTVSLLERQVQQVLPRLHLPANRQTQIRILPSIRADREAGKHISLR